MWDIGVDIVEVGRFRRITYPNHRKFYDGVFTPREIEYCLSFTDPVQHFAATFAGKEAVYKALSRHLNIKLHEIEILRDENGAPEVNLKRSRNDKAKNIGRINLSLEVRVSLSHTSSHAVAFAVVRLQEPKAKSE